MNDPIINRPSYKKALMVYFSLVVIIVLGAYVVTGKFIISDIFKQLAAVFTSKETSPNTAEDISNLQLVVGNELLIKIKSSHISKIKEGEMVDNGIQAFKKMGNDFKVKSLKQIAKKNSKSKNDSEIFRWYKVTFDSPKILVSVGPKNKAAKGDLSESKVSSSLLQAVERIKKDPAVEAVEYNYMVSHFLAPNDPYYSSVGSWGQAYPDLWGMQKIDSSSAWDNATNSASIIVADIDTGVDRNHPDLTANMWTNPGEIQNNGIDDDQNGYIDDYYGWDFNKDDNDPMDDHGHGTHTVGTIAGVGNNGLGVVGLNWSAKVMALKFLDSSGSGYLDDGMLALQYAADMGARVSSNSWGCACGKNTQAMDDAIKYEHDRGMVVVVAAGNSNTDALDFSPASADKAITVAASDPNDLKASFSNFGSKIDVIAPGVDILSTRASNNPMCTGDRNVSNNYCRVSGTSMATPHVAGLATLLLSKNPGLTNEEVRQIIREASNDLGQVGQDSSFGFGRINAKNTIDSAINKPLIPSISSPASRSLIAGTNVAILGQISGSDFASYKVEVSVGRNINWVTIKTSNIQPTAPDTLLASLDSSQFPDGTIMIRLSATNTAGKTYYSGVYDVTIDNFLLSIDSPVFYVQKGSVSIVGSAKTMGNLPFASYKLEVGVGRYPSSWTTLNTGSVAIDNGVLGVWNTSSIADGSEYMLRLTVSATNGYSASYQKNFLVDSTLVSGWPKNIDANKNMYEQPVIGDLLGDGKQEIVVTTINHDYSSMQITAYRYDGSILNGFPINIPNSNIFSRTTSRLTLADINGDGKKEILLTYNNNANNTNKLLVYGGNGQPFPGWTPPNSFGGSIFVKDMNMDGVNDIVTFSSQYDYTNTLFTFTLSAFDQTGNILNGFPRKVTYVLNQQLYMGPVSIHDLDNDGKIEIAFGIDDKLYLLDDQLQLVAGWPYTLPPAGDPGFLRVVNMDQNLTSADFYGDGKRQLFLTNNLQCEVSNGQFQYYCHLGVHSMAIALNKNGTSLSGFPKVGNTEGYYVGGSSMAHADVNNDGADDALVLSKPLVIIKKDSTTKVGTPGIMPLGQGPVLADVNGDGEIDVVVEEGAHSYKELRILNLSGQIIWSRPFSYGLVNPQNVLLADLNGDGKLELIAPANYHIDSNGVQNWSQQIIVWNLDLGSTSNYEWPIFGQNLMRDSNIKVINQIPDTVAPITSFITPPNGTAVLDVVNVNISATDNRAVAKVELYINDILYGTKDIPPYSFVWDTKSMVNGPAVLSSKAYDPVGNIGTSSIQVQINNSNTQPPVVDTTAPTVSITSPVNGSTVNTKGNTNISVSASDNVKVTKVEFYIDGKISTTDTKTPFSYNWPSSKVTSGSHIIMVKAYDAAQNIGTASISVTK